MFVYLGGLCHQNAGPTNAPIVLGPPGPGGAGEQILRSSIQGMSAGISGRPTLS